MLAGLWRLGVLATGYDDQEVVQKCENTKGRVQTKGENIDD